MKRRTWQHGRYIIPLLSNSLIVKVLDTAENPDWIYKMVNGQPNAILSFEEMCWLKDVLLQLVRNEHQLNVFRTSAILNEDCISKIAGFLNIPRFDREHIEIITRLHSSD